MSGLKDFLLYSVFILLLPISYALAQTVENLSIIINPERPRAEQVVELEVETFAFDLNSASITWNLNGKPVARGTGRKTFSFSTGPLGSVSKIQVIVATATGSVFEKSITIRPAEVELVMEAATYTPPFYKGASYFSYESQARVVALPFFITPAGVAIDPKTLTYTWKENGKVYQGFSGYGKNIFIAQSGIPIKPVTVEVEVASSDREYTASASLVLRPQVPSVLFYENHPLYGILFNKALRGKVPLKEREITVVAVPYNFSIEDRSHPILTYKWSMNGAPIASEEGEIALGRPEGDEEGQSEISLQVSNKARIFQFANQSLSISFGKSLEERLNSFYKP